MSAPVPQSFLKHFETLPDPRKQTANTIHQFFDILMIAICGAMCGADHWTAIETFGKAQHDWLQGFLALPGGIPSHDTFTTTFRRLDPEQFHACFVSWVAEIANLLPGEVVAIDGKTLRHSYDRQNSTAALHMVSAWASQQTLVLGQLATEAKSNEITAIPQLLDVLELTGCLVTIDAMGCQKAIARKIRERGADYLLALKDNHPTLHARVQAHFFPEREVDWATWKHLDFAHDIVQNRDRLEHRYCWVQSDLTWLPDVDDWCDLHAVVCLETERHHQGSILRDVRYYLTSASKTAEDILQDTRSHWTIENVLNWRLDVQFHEDASRLRKGHGAENFAILRRLTLNLFRHDSTRTLGLHTKRLKAGWDVEYRERMLQGAGKKS